MNRKMLLLFLMFCSTQIKPFGIIEILALIGCGALVRTKPAQMVIRHAWSQWSTFKQSKSIPLSASNNVESSIKIDHGATQGLRFSLSKAREFALQGKRNLASILTAMQTRTSSLWQSSVNQSETTMHVASGSIFRPRVQPIGRACTKSENAQSEYYQFTQVTAQKRVSQASGFLPRITNNYYSGKAEEVIFEIGKKRFWQGACLGGVVTAWLLNPNESKQKKHTKD